MDFPADGIFLLRRAALGSRGAARDAGRRGRCRTGTGMPGRTSHGGESQRVEDGLKGAAAAPYGWVRTCGRPRPHRNGGMFQTRDDEPALTPSPGRNDPACRRSGPPVPGPCAPAPPPAASFPTDRRTAAMRPCAGARKRRPCEGGIAPGACSRNATGRPAAALARRNRAMEKKTVRSKRCALSEGARGRLAGPRVARDNGIYREQDCQDRRFWPICAPYPPPADRDSIAS